MTERINRKQPRRVDKPAPPIGLERAFTVDQIAQTGVACRAKLYNDIKAGRLKAIKFGRSTRITESAYRAYLESAPTL
jgi:excisionase family DNA binding protein